MTLPQASPFAEDRPRVPQGREAPGTPAAGAASAVSPPARQGSHRFVVSFGAGLLCLLGVILLPLVAALLGIGWYATERLEEKVLAARIQTLESTISTLADQGFRRFGNTQQGLADSGVYASSAATLAKDAPGRRALMGMLQRHPNMTAGYVGFTDGGFLYVAQVERMAEARREEIGVPEGAVTASRVIIGDGYERIDGWTFLDAGGKELVGRASTLPDYDPRTRTWFRDAVKAGQPVVTEPYTFTGAGGDGITIATPLPGGAGVIGADLTLAIVSRLLSTHKISPSSLIMVTTDSGAALGRSDLPAVPAQRELADWMTAEIRNLASSNRDGMIALRRFGGVDIRLQTRALAPVFDRRLFLAVAAPMPELTAETGALITRSAFVAVAAVVIAFVGGVAASRLLSKPLGHIADKTDQFRQLDFSDVSRIDSRVSEINRLETAVEQMRGGLEQFGRYVPRQLVRRVIESPAGAAVGGIRQPVTVMFTDIEHFSTTAEGMDPEQLMARLSKYLESLGGAMVRHGGTIDKYIGDSIMAIWNAPEPDADHVTRACRAALAAAATSEWLEKKWEQRGRETFRTRCGLHTGVAVVGNVGSLDRLSYTVVGTIPNQASRLEGLNKVYGTKILASGPVFEAAREHFVWRHIDKVVPVGAILALDLYEPMAEADAAASPAHEKRSIFLSRWNDALAAYRRGDMAGASRAFHALAHEHPADGPCQTFAQRCDVFVERGLPRDWNGVTVFQHK